MYSIYYLFIKTPRACRWLKWQPSCAPAVLMWTILQTNVAMSPVNLLFPFLPFLQTSTHLENKMIKCIKILLIIYNMIVWQTNLCLDLLHWLTFADLHCPFGSLNPTATRIASSPMAPAGRKMAANHKRTSRPVSTHSGWNANDGFS